MKGRCNKDFYDSKVAQLALLEQRSERGEIDLLYGDETQVSEEGYVPYGWQCKGEQVAIASAKGERINCFGLLSRANAFEWKSSKDTITADFVIAQLDTLSWRLDKETVVVLDNARVHQNGKMKAMQKIWAERKLFIFFLPPYSPHLNIIERLWKELKARWLCPADYTTPDTLGLALYNICNAIGNTLRIQFSPFSII